MNSSSKTIFRLAFALAFGLNFSLGAYAQQRPLITEDVDIIPPGSLRIEAGIDFLQNAKFPVSGRTGDLTRAGGSGIRIGLAPNVEVQVAGVAHNALRIHSRGPGAIQFGAKPGATSSDAFGESS